MPSQALLFSQTGPFSSRPFTTIPRALLLRRLRLPLPLSARTCRCRRPLDPLGDHRAAWLPARACSSPRAPRGRGSSDDRRIEVIANRLLLWNGAQLAVDTTIVSPPTAAGEARSRRDPARPVALLEARRRKEATYPELLASARCRLVVIGVEVGGRWGSEAASFLRLLARAKSPSRAGGPSPCPSIAVVCTRGRCPP